MTKKKAKPRRATPRTVSRTPTSHFPKGWDQKRADEVAKYYENQSDEEAIAEMEVGLRGGPFTMMQIPTKLVPEVRKLLAKRAG